MRFLADMGISPETVNFLQTLGHESIHLVDEGLDRLPDQAIVAKARDERRILLVHDLGFGELVAASGAALPSVITFRLRNMRPERVNKSLERLLPEHKTALERGALLTVTESQVRVRLLPLNS